MDFSFTDEQQAIAALAKQILTDGATLVLTPVLHRVLEPWRRRRT